jgi:hypothetical protein
MNGKSSAMSNPSVRPGPPSKDSERVFGYLLVANWREGNHLHFYINILTTYYPDLDPPYDVYYQQILEQIELAEELGWECFMFNEHHFLAMAGSWPIRRCFWRRRAPRAFIWVHASRSCRNPRRSTSPSHTVTILLQGQSQTTVSNSIRLTRIERAQRLSLSLRRFLYGYITCASLLIVF